MSWWTLEVVSQGGGRCNIPGQAGLGSEQPGLVKVTLLIAGGLDWMNFKGLFQSRLLCDSVRTGKLELVFYKLKTGKGHFSGWF